MSFLAFCDLAKKKNHHAHKIALLLWKKMCWCTKPLSITNFFDYLEQRHKCIVQLRNIYVAQMVWVMQQVSFGGICKGAHSLGSWRLHFWALLWQIFRHNIHPASKIMVTLLNTNNIYTGTIPRFVWIFWFPWQLHGENMVTFWPSQPWHLGCKRQG